MGQCQCPTTINRQPDANIPNYALLTYQLYLENPQLDTLHKQVKPTLNQLIEFLRDNWIRVPHVIAIIEEKLTNAEKECDIHASLIALTAIMKLINRRISQEFSEQGDKSRLSHLDLGNLAQQANKASLSESRTKSESRKTSSINSVREFEQQLTQQVTIVQQKLLKCIIIVQDKQFPKLPFPLYQNLLGQLCANLTVDDPRLMQIVLMLQDVLTKYFLKKLQQSFEELPGPLKVEVNNRRKKKLIIGMLSKESKVKDTSIDKIVEALDEDKCTQLVGMYLRLISVIEKNRKTYELTTLFINDDQKLLLQTFIYLKVKEDNVANFYLFEFLDLYHKKAVQMKLFQELFEGIFMNFDERLWEDQPIITTLFGILLKSAHYEDIKDDHELYILSALFSYLDRVSSTTPNLRVINTVLLCIELFLNDLGYGEFLSYQMSSKFPLLIVMALLTRDQQAVRLILVWFKLLEAEHTFFDYFNLILDYILSIMDYQSKENQQDIVLLLQLQLQIVGQQALCEQSIYLADEVVLRLFDIARYPSFEIQTIVMQVTKSLIVDAKMIMTHECQSMFFCVYWMLESHNASIRTTMNELSLKHFFEITNQLLKKSTDNLVINFIGHIRGQYESSNPTLKSLCQLITFILVDNFQEIKGISRVSAPILNARVSHPVQLSILKKLLKLDLSISQQYLDGLLNEYPREKLFNIAQQRIGIKQSFRRESIGSIHIHQTAPHESLGTVPQSSYQSDSGDNRDFDYLFNRLTQRVDLTSLFNSGNDKL